MEALILDVGNSRAKLFRWEGDHQGPSLGAEAPPLLALIHQWETRGPEADFQMLAQDVAACFRSQGDLPLVVSSVVPEAVAALIASRNDPIVVDHRMEFPFSCAVEDPAAVGADRYCNMAAACGAGLSHALVVDVGTATTFDLLVGGVFLGGLIAPGPEFAQQCLGRQAARLNPVDFGPAPLAAGANTAEAMARGGWNTGILGIQGTIGGLLDHYGEMPVILTGGLGGHLAGPGRFHDPHFSLRGAACLGGLLSR